jgi:hypothetical protein
MKCFSEQFSVLVDLQVLEKQTVNCRIYLHNDVVLIRFNAKLLN